MGATSHTTVSRPDSDDIFDSPSEWRATIAGDLGLRGLELFQALGAGPAYPSALQSAIASCDLGETSTVVDLGAGIGATSEYVRRATGAAVVAVEPSAGSRAACLRLFPSVFVIAATAEAVPLCDGIAAAVMLNGVLSLVDDAQPPLAEACRLVPVGGVVAITDLFLSHGDQSTLGNNTFRSIESMIEILRSQGLVIIEVGVGPPTPRPDWAEPQRVVDELVSEHFEDHPGFAAFMADKAHLDDVMRRRIVIGGSVTARRVG